MPIRKASAYSKKKITFYTRKSMKVKSKNYIKAVPNQKVTKFNMGNVRKYNHGEYKNLLKMNSLMNIQIRDMALESARQFLNNQLTKKFVDNYALFCKPFPHQVIRENKTFSGGSKGERVQSGMAHSFGTTMFRSAYVKVGSPIFIIAYSNKKDTDFVRHLCKSASAKLPCSIQIIFEEVK
jgi:ribosomal protein L16/L10AE